MIDGLVVRQRGADGMDGIILVSFIRSSEGYDTEKRNKKIFANGWASGLFGWGAFVRRDWLICGWRHQC